MIHWANLLQLLGYFVLALALAIAVALGVALFGMDAGVVPLTLACAICLAVGGALAYFFRSQPVSFNNRDGILLVILTWMAASFLGALPFYLSSSFPSFTDAVFESVSGFTTTGATILSDIESLPDSLLFWRSFTQWVGGMGIILLGIAILPLIGTGGLELYRAEFSGASSEKLKPRIAETAFSLWKIYLSLTLAAILSLWLAGMNPFEAVCHGFTAMATAGFSTRNASVEGFASPAIEYVLVFFMAMGGINFTRHYRLFIERRPSRFLRDTEVRIYLLLIALSTAAISYSLLESQTPGSLEETIRASLFQVVSIITTTGYSSSNFEEWTAFAQLALLALMFVGGCTGSTAGGLKTARLVLLLRVVGREFRQIVERRGVFAVRFNGSAVSESTIKSLLNLVYLAFLINFAATLFLTAFGIDILTAISAVAAAMFNIGPGLAEVGPSDNYGWMAAPVKWALAFCMLAGRLEYYTLFVIATRAFWRK